MDSGGKRDLVDRFAINLTGPLNIIVPTETYNGLFNVAELKLAIQVKCTSGYKGDRCEIPLVGVTLGPILSLLVIVGSLLLCVVIIRTIIVRRKKAQLSSNMPRYFSLVRMLAITLGIWFG